MHTRRTTWGACTPHHRLSALIQIMACPWRGGPPPCKRMVCSLHATNLVGHNAHTRQPSGKAPLQRRPRGIKGLGHAAVQGRCIRRHSATPPHGQLDGWQVNRTCHPSPAAAFPLTMHCSAAHVLTDAGPAAGHAGRQLSSAAAALHAPQTKMVREKFREDTNCPEWEEKNTPRCRAQKHARARHGPRPSMHLPTCQLSTPHPHHHQPRTPAASVTHSSKAAEEEGDVTVTIPPEKIGRRAVPTPAHSPPLRGDVPAASMPLPRPNSLSHVP